MLSRLPQFRKGQTLKATDLNTLVDAINSVLSISASPPLAIRRDATGLAISVMNDADEVEAVLKTPLVRGGTADAEVQIWDGTGWVKTGREVKVRDRSRILVGKKLGAGKPIGAGKRGLVHVLTAYDCEDLETA